MAYTEQAQAVTMLAGANLTKAKFLAITGAKTVGLGGASDVDGVSGETVNSGESLPMVFSGITLVTLGATLAAGAVVSSDASGDAIAAGAAGTLTCGKIIDGGDAGDLVPMLIDIRRVHA